MAFAQVKLSGSSKGFPSLQAQDAPMTQALLDRPHTSHTDQPTLGPGRYLLLDSDTDVTVVPLAKPVTHLGRGFSCDVRFDDATVSRRHAVVVDRDGSLVLIDDRSMDGTWLNGARVDQAVLRHGDAIDVGRTRLEYLEIHAA